MNATEAKARTIVAVSVARALRVKVTVMTIWSVKRVWSAASTTAGSSIQPPRLPQTAAWTNQQPTKVMPITDNQKRAVFIFYFSSVTF